MEIAVAIQELRRHLGLSQQDFATATGLSVRAIASYEAGRRPATDSLIALWNVASGERKLHLAKVFMAALDENMARILPGNPLGCLPFRSKREWLYMRAVQLAVKLPTKELTAVEKDLKRLTEYLRSMGLEPEKENRGRVGLPIDDLKG